MTELDAGDRPATPLTAELLADALAALAADAMAGRLCANISSPPLTSQAFGERRLIYSAVALDWSTKWPMVQLADEAAPIVGRLQFLARLGLRERDPALLSLGDTYVRRRASLTPSQDSIHVR
ncbi:hypothetical protein [Reyranella sp.]|uniref:hypothetical protein n=1 Tax=Reyranella sp. TaxID=1929291 RepID=UPI0040371D77